MLPGSMIFDHMDNASLYLGLGERFAAAFAYLRAFTPEIADGKHLVEGEDIFAAVQTYESAPAAERKWESHRRYADIQYIHSGEELIYHRDVSTLVVKTPYNLEKDYVIYDGPEDQALVMRAGNFAVFWPHDGHKPSCALGAPTPVRKVVMKVRVA